MSRRPPFEPIGFAEHLEKTGNYYTANDQLLQWTGTHWVSLSTRESESTGLRWLVSSGQGVASSTNAKAACATALLWLPTLKAPEKLPVIPVLNGYVHIDSAGLTLKPHDKELGLRHIVNCEYNPRAAVPTEFNKFLACALPDTAVRERVQEYVGYTLMPDAPHQVAQFWLGGGANGKGVLANIVQALHRKIAAINLDDMDGFNMTDVIDASLIYCDEAPQNKIKDRAFKTLTAAETTQINRRYRDPISVKVMGKWLILGNHIPEVTDHSEGFWRRLDIVPFEVTVPKAERDPMLARRIIERELTGVLNWALEGVVRLQARGRFDPVLPPAMQQTLEIAQVDSDPVRTWSQESEIGLKTASDTLKADVYSSYSAWCRSNGFTVDSSVKFWKRFSKLFKGMVESRLQTREGYRRACNVQL